MLGNFLQVEQWWKWKKVTFFMADVMTLFHLSVLVEHDGEAASYHGPRAAVAIINVINYTGSAMTFQNVCHDKSQINNPV